MAKLSIAELDEMNFGFVCDYIYKYNQTMKQIYGSQDSQSETVTEATQADFNRF
jgi:hypothetical protein